MQPEISPPPGYAPGQTRSPVVLGFTSSLIPLALILVSMRFYVRHHILHSVGLDDWLLLAALLMLITTGIMAVWAITKGLGRHDYDITMAGGNPVKDLEVVCSLNLCVEFDLLIMR